ncbi:shikimate dehydrogenase [Sutcliffiella halmapala]|uniref:shikimate dehydrogenase n=1 Tax=Sutcliffiella halmapala TaxID=79882 RepID=UPI0009952C5B|nr:shikimate dehydrogenase [Sutcliffiella halmapala]
MKKLYGVIGSPIQHSMSPLIHNDAFLQLGIDAHYHAFHVLPKDLEAAVVGLKALGVAGFNVTIPHKKAIIPLLDEVDNTALKIGAVNTVVNENGKWTGYNTDGPGYVAALKQITATENKHILIIGAGGAARAILYSLVKEPGAKVDIFNRTPEKAQHLIEEFSLQGTSRAVTMAEVVGNMPNYDVIVQTTSVGMHPHIEDSPVQIATLKKNAIVSDIIYNPLETDLLKQAKLKGAITQNGVQMFVYQAALAFQYWTNRVPDVHRMEKIVTERLGGTTC